MKKSIIVIFSAIVGAIIGNEIFKKTKEKQEKAKAKGMHIPYGPYEAIFKRPLDVVASSVTLLLLSPIMVIVALIVRINLGGSILFIQERPGLNGKVFKIFKYRTMTDKRGANGKLLPDKDRITYFGKILRSTSLDELPELVNIIKGDMAIVGPRPLLVEYLPRYDEKQKHRHDVKPGLTGLAQVRGRNSLSWNEKFENDIKYVNRITFLGDIGIIIKTFIMVLKKDWINSNISVTMEIFVGNEGN